MREVKEMGEASFFHELCVTWHDRDGGGAAGGSLLPFPHLIFQVNHRQISVKLQSV